jgi:hypothetical protein
MLIYIWLILTIPHDRLVCELWTRTLPTQPALIQACGTDALGDYRLDVTLNGKLVCSTSAANLAWVHDDCNLNASLDTYRLRIIEPNVQSAICTVRTETQDKPSWDVIAGQCPNAQSLTANGIEIRLRETRPFTTPEPDTVCKPPAVEQPASIATSKDYYLLAGKLIWFGLAKPACTGGYSGLDPLTLSALPCGMDGARPQMIAWQNGLDESILVAAREWNVPAATLKQLIADETQFWTWTGEDGEHGLIQITDAGAAVVMHMYQDGYYHMSDTRKQNLRTAWLQKLDCLNCSPVAAYEHAKQVMSQYAQALAAYYCMYGSWDNALRAWNIKHAKEN